MRILITGINGQVGHALMQQLQYLNGMPMEVIGLDRNGLDLSRPQQIREVIRRLQPALIVNPAAYTAVDQAESDAAMAMRINGEAPGILAVEAHRYGAALIHYSTDYVFDGSKDAPYDETDRTCPINVYGHTKLAGEQAIAASGVAHLILRTSWVYGRRGKNFFNTVSRLAAEHTQMRIVADQYGAPTWCSTIAHGTATAIERLCRGATGAAQQAGDAVNPASSGSGNLGQALSIMPHCWARLGGIVHLSAQGSTSWHGFASEIVAHGSRAAQVQVVPIASAEYQVAAARPRNSRLACGRFLQQFGALPDWQVALADCLAQH